ncbi:nucleic-acid-binding protein from transposon X-element [Trichonephila clavata]|uniref:Nucleic-acid-binding protein from transposon X-element n=1 Tax=Trichonephila clavata TaxID=2740835 RepID=A0A8X6KGG3_TRICU|nr:nucleic-acid-binding protein from transposon X-element [Trichonephila clavata]
MQAFTYQLKEDKEFNVVLHGMPADMSPQEIMDDLLVLGISPSYCHIMTNRKTHLPMPLFLVSLPSNEDNRNIYNISEVCSVKVTVEVLNKKPGPAQCYHCQGFFHNSRYCSKNPRCLKCLKPHMTMDCKKTLSEDPTCCNCQEKEMLAKLRKNSSLLKKPNSAPPKPTSVATKPPTTTAPKSHSLLYSKALADSLPKKTQPLVKPPEAQKD